MAFITYKQADSRWGKKNYNGSSTMATAGCGPTSCAMIAYGVDGKTTPLDTMKYMQKHGYAIRNNGTAWNGIPNCLKAFGVKDVQEVTTMAKCWELMKKGYVGVFLFRKGTKGGVTWTTSGHYIAVTDYKYQNNKHYVYTRDSGGRNHTGWYAYETTMKGLIPKIWLGYVGKPKPLPKPKGKYSGAIPKPTLKKGSRGDSVKQLQNFLNWYSPSAKLKVDGIFGGGTESVLEIFQATEGISADGIYGKQSYTKAMAYKQNTDAKKPAPTVSVPVQAKGYEGAFPDLIVHSGQRLYYSAKELAWAKGTAKAKYTYPKGNPTIAFHNAINKVYPNRKTWSKQCQAGASCDVGIGTVVRHSGFDTKMPRGLDEQIPHLEKSNLFKKTDLTQASQMKPGDIGIYTGNGAHIWMGLGNKQIAEASHTLKLFLHVSGSNPKKSSHTKWGVYRACVPTAIRKGDKGTEVVKLQKFLNWYGNYGLAEDGIFGTKTEMAVKDFQGMMGITKDGWFGSASLTKAKNYRKPPSSGSVTSVKKIVDVSYWQHTIDWKKASKEVDGAILRCSYTGQKSFSLSEDSTFLPNIIGASQYGLKVGAYHYSQAISVDEAKKEAVYICKKLSGYKDKITLPVVCDWEFGGRLNSKKAKSLGKAKCTEIVSAFCEVVTSYGFTPMIYANYSTFSSYLDYPKLKKKYLIWLAQYSSKASLGYDYWQYTSSGSVSGINGKVDLSKAVR